MSFLEFIGGVALIVLGGFILCWIGMTYFDFRRLERPVKSDVTYLDRRLEALEKKPQSEYAGFRWLAPTDPAFNARCHMEPLITGKPSNKRRRASRR